MEIIYLKHNEINNMSNDEYVVAIGNFDGIHLGHREVIRKAKSIATDKKLKLGVMSFDITPRQLVNKIDNYYILRSFKQKEAILEELGVETLFLIEFNENIRNLNPDDFIKEMIIKSNIKYLVCGFDFSFGKNKEGNVNLLEKYNEFETVILPRADHNNKKISSTLIHEMILHGEIREANKLLVKPYSIVGKVIKGNQKGRMIGFPTANLLPETNYRIPESGVYASKVIVDGKEYNGMTNIGHNPTFNFRNTTSIETNIFDFDEDIYDKEIEVIFVENIRKEKIFNGVADLVSQVKIDKEKIIKILK